MNPVTLIICALLAGAVCALLVVAVRSGLASRRAHREEEARWAAAAAESTPQALARAAGARDQWTAFCLWAGLEPVDPENATPEDRAAITDAATSREETYNPGRGYTERFLREPDPEVRAAYMAGARQGVDRLVEVITAENARRATYGDAAPEHVRLARQMGAELAALKETAPELDPPRDRPGWS